MTQWSNLDPTGILRGMEAAIRDINMRNAQSESTESGANPSPRPDRIGPKSE